eukprot:4159003-Amphidinium_carterae.1
MCDLGCTMDFHKKGGSLKTEAGKTAQLERHRNVYTAVATVKSGSGEPLMALPLAQGIPVVEPESAEAWTAKPLAVPVRPSKAEVEAHNLTHLPYRSWCPHCVRAKARPRGHFA